MERPSGRRPRWFDPTRTEHISAHLPLTDSSTPASDDVLSRCWARFRLTSGVLDARPSIRITEMPPRMTRGQYQAIKKKDRSRKRQKTSLARKKDDVDARRRVFSLRLAPTKEQKLYFQRAFGIACLAKRLAYKYLGDQRVPMTSEHMLELRTRLCTEDIETQVWPEGVTRTKGKKGGYKVESRPNDFLPLKFRRRLFETELQEMDKKARAFFETTRTRATGRRPRMPRNWTVPLWRRPIPCDVRNNAVLQFCRAVQTTQAQTAERQAPWDAKMVLHEKFLAEQARALRRDTLNRELGTALLSDATKRKRTRANQDDRPVSAVGKYPPRGQRPEMAARQVKPPDRNAPTQCFQIDARSTNKRNPFSASWKDGEVSLMGLQIGLWGSPSRQKRELSRLSQFMPDGEHGTRKQATIKYDHGRYYLQVQRLLVGDAPSRARSPTEPARIVALDPGIRTFQGVADSSGRFGEIGEGQVERLIRVVKRADRVQSHIATELGGHTNKSKRKRARRRLRRHNAKARDLKNDAHWKVARALCDNYDDILIPRFHCRAMKRCLASSTTRRLNLWSHFEFRQRLKHKAEELGARVHEVAEPQTSITCTSCLWIEESFCNNSAKRFVCRRCGFIIDRDRNGARNIMLRTVERHVGRIEPLVPSPVATQPTTATVAVSTTTNVVLDLTGDDDDDDDDDDECTGWMWTRRRNSNSKTTASG